MGDIHGWQPAACPKCGSQIMQGAITCTRCGHELNAAPGTQSDLDPRNFQYANANYPPPSMHAPRKNTTTAWIIGLVGCVVLVPVIGIIAAIALPNFIKVKEKAKGAETKQGLHEIQLAVERYAIDHDGHYPDYLIGGEAKWAAGVDVDVEGAAAFTGIQECDEVAMVSDPLLREGYLTAYPKNPFIRDPVPIHRVQETLVTYETDEDPLRNSCEDGRSLGTRFGSQCNLMGSVLADTRYDEFTVPEPGTIYYVTEYTWADVEYEFWDMWVGEKPTPFLPGQFFYKSCGPVVPDAALATSNVEIPDPSEEYRLFPTSTDTYILGGYGGIRTKGKDVLGEEEPLIYLWTDQTTSETKDIEIWLWTRSEVKGDFTAREGSPFAPNHNVSLNDPVQYGNPNGIQDSLILVLTD